MEAISSFLGSFGGERVLDLACGDGWFSEYLADDLRHCGSIVGVDVDRREIVEAADGWGHSVPAHFEFGSVMDLRFADGEFDVVAISNALHHVVRPDVALAEARRVLSPDGVLIVHEMTSEVAARNQENARDFHHLKARVDRLLRIPHQETLSEGCTRDLITRAGFSIERTDRYEPEAQTDPEAIDARIEFIRDYINHVNECSEFAQIRKGATLLAERIRVSGFAPAPQLLIAARPRSA